MKTEHKILFTSVPELEKLKYFIGLIDFSEKLYASSNYTWQKMKTRCLIETHPYILAAPVERKISHIHIIFPGNFTCGEIKNFTNQTNLTLSGQNPLLKETYLECILFTMTVRLSPDWNRIEKYFVKGDFSNAFETAEAVRFQLLLTDGCLAFSTWALRLKLPSANLIDLEVDFKGLFKDGFAIVRRKVFALPYLKPGTAICLYAKLPSTCPFKSYDEIKTHWRKLYGYNLPSSEENMIYVEVIFNSNGFSYLYPIVCVCSYKPIHFQSRNELKVIDEFTKLLTNKFSRICRHPIEINVKDDGIFRPVSKLHLASEVLDKANLSLLLSDNKVIQDFQNENVAKCDLTIPCKVRLSYKKFHSYPLHFDGSTNTPIGKKAQKRGRSPPLFLPSFEQVAPKPTEETFKCFPIFSPTVKAYSPPGNPDKKLKSSQAELLDQVKDFVNTKSLHKMSLQTLLKFCKGNGIPTRKKEKKETVLEKIYNYFN